MKRKILLTFLVLACIIPANKLFAQFANDGKVYFYVEVGNDSKNPCMKTLFFNGTRGAYYDDPDGTAHQESDVRKDLKKDVNYYENWAKRANYNFNYFSSTSTTTTYRYIVNVDYTSTSGSYGTLENYMTFSNDKKTLTVKSIQSFRNPYNGFTSSSTNYYNYKLVDKKNYLPSDNSSSTTTSKPSSSSTTTSYPSSSPTTTTYPVYTGGQTTGTQNNTYQQPSTPQKKWRTVTRQVDCPSCHGTGQCPSCNGSGHLHNIGTSGTRDCPNCHNGRCSTCGGSGKITKTEQVYE